MCALLPTSTCCRLEKHAMLFITDRLIAPYTGSDQTFNSGKLDSFVDLTTALQGFGLLAVRSQDFRAVHVLWATQES